MLELYHHGSSVCAAKVRFALAEKQLIWEGHYLDILKGEQFTPEYRKINPKSVVPTLVHDGRVIPESILICEYIDEVFPNHPLLPADPYSRVQARLWTKAVDEVLHPACASVTFMISHRHIVAKLGPAALEAFLSNTPKESITPRWKEQKRAIVEQGFDAPGAVDQLKLYVSYLDKMEESLGNGPWLLGNEFSIGDVSLAPYVNRLSDISMSGLWEEGRRPRLADWYHRIKVRPTFKPSFTDWVPADLIADMNQNGAKSWDDVVRVLDIR